MGSKGDRRPPSIEYISRAPQCAASSFLECRLCRAVVLAVVVRKKGHSVLNTSEQGNRARLSSLSGTLALAVGSATRGPSLLFRERQAIAKRGEASFDVD